MNKPLIGVTPLIDVKKESYWMLPGYMKGIEKAGGIPVMLPYNDEDEILEEIIQRVDGILLTGGNDIDPKNYHEENRACGPSLPLRDSLEMKLFALCMKYNKPVLGICRGIQMINVCMGGTLYQDLITEHISNVNHRMTPPYDQMIHTNTIIKDSLLYKILNKEEIQVNTRHHQAIKQLGKGLEINAISEDGLIEAVNVIDHPFALGVQWHPEHFTTNQDADLIFKYFIQAAGRK